ncbi:multiple sugar transport system substrate-binding protein [Bradyrhizobium ottawaense]
MANDNASQLYAGACADVSDVSEAIASKQGDFYRAVKAHNYDGSRWQAVPFCIFGTLVVYRKSWFTEAGATQFPTTWDNYRSVGRRLKSKGKPIGQSLGRAVGDAPAFWYPFFWSFGGREVEPDGKSVNLQTRNVIESVKFATAFCTDACDDGGLAWDNSGNNRAFLSSTVSATLNGSVIYLEAKRKPDRYLTDDGKPMMSDMLHATVPAGPAGQFSVHPTHNHMIMNYSSNVEPAKELLTWLSAPENYRPWFVAEGGFVCGATTMWEKDQAWLSDPILTPFRDAPRTGQVYGYPGPSGQKAAEAISKFIIVDMYAKAVQGMAAEDAVRWAEGELKKIYTA